MDRTYMLTTLDNPFNPFTQYDAWYNYDVEKGHNTCAYLARIVKSSDELSEEDEKQAISDAIDEILNLDLLGNHIKVDSDYIPKPVEPEK